MVFMWCGSVPLHHRRSPCLHTWRIMCVMVCIFILFGCGLTLFAFTDPIWIISRGVRWGRQCAYDWIEPCQTSWCTLWPTFSHPRIRLYLTPLHLLLLRKKTICCKETRYPSLISLTSIACAGFSKNFPISATAFAMASVVETKGILVDCGKFDCVC